MTEYADFPPEQAAPQGATPLPDAADEPHADAAYGASRLEVDMPRLGSLDSAAAPHPDAPHPAEAYASEFDATAPSALEPVRETPSIDAAVLPFPTHQDPLAAARRRLLELQTEQVEPLRAAVLSHGAPTRGNVSALNASSAPAVPTPRLAQRVQGLLDEAEIAADECDWAQAAEWLRDALVLEPENADALALLAMVTRRLAAAEPPAPDVTAAAPNANPAVNITEAPAARVGGSTSTPELGGRTGANAALPIEIAISRWEARGYRLRERTANAATLVRRRSASLRGFLTSLVLGVGLGGAVYLVYALLVQRRREIRLTSDGERVAVSGQLRERDSVVVSLAIVAITATAAAVGLLALGAAQMGGLL